MQYKQEEEVTFGGLSGTEYMQSEYETRFNARCKEVNGSVFLGHWITLHVRQLHVALSYNFFSLKTV